MVIPTIYILNMPRKMNKHQLLVLVFILLLMFLNITATTILIPSYSFFQQLYALPPGFIYLADAAFTFMAAIFSVVWGYTADKINKKIVIMIGLTVSTFGFFITYAVQTFPELILARAISGCGMGMVYPIGFSMIADLSSIQRTKWLVCFFGDFWVIS